ncbi:B-cell receptor-associated 31-like protein [Ceraceosorus guamensis]|uniref:Endoplasmic reticulum transmembrane protein n=1 Tax=Ceraceosorus guamensis TaxID=1522189 RepID=A0A316VZR1_9BASI|nr:B-cell receptor-associated 31-like protein [Ceraceosorus guamensis]PWN43157.1 B-cell receptor-associated 31-like protein [Ceraceosorus guamensis]
MTIHYSLCFGLLVSEMIVFLLLILPFPFKIRRAIFRFFATNAIVGKVLYGVKISIIFVSILFVDACQRLLKTMAERQQAKEQLGVRDTAHHDMLLRLAFAQRNCYLCGFCLFCSLILARTYALITELIQAQEAAGKTQAEPASDSNVATLKKQVAQQQAEYNRLADELAAVKGEAARTRDD